MLDEKYINLEISDEPFCKKIISVEINPDSFQDEKEKVLRSFVKEVSLPGFRKGKVPADTVRKRFSGEIQAEAVKKILPQAYGHAVESRKLEPIGDPVFRDIKMDEGQPLKFSIEVEVAPDIRISEYRGIAVDAEGVDVAPEEIDQVLGNLQDRGAEYPTVDRPAVTDDIVVIDFTPIGEDGAAEEDKRVEDYPVQLGAGQVLKDFEEAIAGKEAGRTGKVDVQYPDDYNPEHLAGRKISYEFKIKEVKEKRVPPLDDEFASKVDSTFKDLESLRDDIKRRLLEEKEGEARRRMQEKAVDILLERNQFEVPESMIEKLKNQIHEEDSKRREMAGVGPEQDEEKKKKMEGLVERIALRNVKRYFLIEHIAGLENISVSSEEIDEELKKMAGERDMPVEEVRKAFHKKSDNYANLKGHLRERKVLDLIIGSSKTD